MRCLFANSFQLFADMAKRRLLGRRPRGPRFSESMGVLLVALASFSYTAAQAQDPSKTWDTLTEAVQRLYKEGKFKDALDAAVQREKFASATLGETSAKYAESLNDLGLLQKTLGNFVEAEKNYRRAIDIDRVASGPNHPFVAKKLNTLGNLLRETGRSDGAIPVFLEAIKIGETQPKTDRSELASWYGNLANTYYGLALYSLSESNFKTALELSAIVDGPRHENRARYLNNYSNVLLKQGRAGDQGEPRHRYREARADGSADRLRSHKSGAGLPGAGPLSAGAGAASERVEAADRSLYRHASVRCCVDDQPRDRASAFGPSPRG
jgi:tetratricopeptide (TPR) repeat protein